MRHVDPTTRWHSCRKSLPLRPALPPRQRRSSPSGAHVVIVTSRNLHLWHGGQLKPDFTYQPSRSRAVPVVLDAGVRLDLRNVTWNGERARPPMSAMDDDNAFEIAAWLGPGVDVSVAQNLGTRFNPASLVVNARMTRADGARSRWGFVIDGLGTGAVLPDGRVAVASRTGKLSFLSAWGDHATGSAIPIFEVETGLPIYALSFTEAGLVALFAEGSVKEAWTLGLPPPGRSVPGTWTTGVACFNADGAEMWRASVPFGATEPAVDASGGRVIIAGRGVVALEEGKVVWSFDADRAAMATAFGDGSLAIVLGPELRLVDRDGDSIARLMSPPEPPATDGPGPPFVTPPAVAADGSIWVATERRLFVAR